ncbi:MAG: efflux RND transporter permease subunit [Bacteroidales bacterium]|nr:efflux RND transporter permease subunit [Bacteroidales bacterium]
MLEKILNQKALINIILFAVLIGGVFSYSKIGKLEDAEIPIKSAMVITPYPGATAHEVELEVTDVLEKAIQKLENVDDIISVSEPGLSKITIKIQQTVKTPDLPQLWDHLRRKINDAKGKLPSGAMEPIVNDDFADVYGILYAITADGYSLKEMTDYTEYLERELLEIDGVKRSQIFGKQQETVDVLFSPEKLAGLNINPMYISMAMQNYSQIVNPGNIIVGKESIRVGVGNKINSIKEIEDLLIQVPQGGSFRLSDIATVKRSVMTPKRETLYFNGIKGLALGLSNESGINVVKLGEKIDKRIEQLKTKLPAGIEMHSIYSQPSRVDEAVQDFMWNLVMSVGIVIVVLLFSMGYRSGLLISSGLVFTIMATLIVMFVVGMPLHRVTLAAIILAMGMLVDNSIVVADGILIDLKRGLNRNVALMSSAKRTAMPLLGATVVAILAFLPLAMAPNAAGEFMSSLFSVLIISLSLSWVFAMVQTPFMAKYFYRKERPDGENKDMYNTRFYRGFKNIVTNILSHKYISLAGSILILIFSFYGFKYIIVDFIPGVDYDQFVVEYNLPQGADIDAVDNDIVQLQNYVMKLNGVRSVTTSLGRPPIRYSLMRPMPTGGQNYGELIVETKTVDDVDKLLPVIRKYISKNFLDANFRIHKYGSSFSDYDIEVEFQGPDPLVLRKMAEQAKKIFRDEPTIVSVTDNWKNRVKTLNPVYSVEKAQSLNLTRKDLANSILVTTNGMPIGAFYEGDVKIPIMLKTAEPVARNIKQLLSAPVWGQQSRFSVPINQIVDTIGLNWEDDLVCRLNGKRAIKVQGDALEGLTAAQAQSKIQQKIEAIQLPEGYTMEWDGTVASSGEANSALFMFLPLALGLMLMIIVALFNNIKQAMIIFIVVPFAFVGISFGFNLTRSALNFMGVIGALGLIGMMIKNAVVLLDEINLNLKSGKNPLKATIDSAVSRLRPVMMASLTTILGMIPLLSDPLFKSMSITIMFGLLIGSVITLVVVPVLYVVFFKVDVKELKNKA